MRRCGDKVVHGNTKQLTLEVAFQMQHLFIFTQKISYVGTALAICIVFSPIGYRSRPGQGISQPVPNRTSSFNDLVPLGGQEPYSIRHQFGHRGMNSDIHSLLFSGKKLLPEGHEPRTPRIQTTPLPLFQV